MNNFICSYLKFHRNKDRLLLFLSKFCMSIFGAFASWVLFLIFCLYLQECVHSVWMFLLALLWSLVTKHFLHRNQLFELYGLSSTGCMINSCLNMIIGLLNTITLLLQQEVPSDVTCVSRWNTTSSWKRCFVCELNY